MTRLERAAYERDREERKSSSSSTGIGFFGALGILFIGLKLAGVIDWSWVWVTAPLWGGFALALVVIAIYCALLYFGNKPSNRWR